MHAIQVHAHGGPEVLEFVELPELEPAEDQIRVDLEAAGVNPVDTYQRAGSQGYARELPFTPGIDGAGVVSAVGSPDLGFGTGDRVYLAGSLTGTYATQCLCSPDQLDVLPEQLSFEQGAALWVNYATAYRALFQRGNATTAERVLVHGATGGVGVAAVQWCKHHGIAVAGTYGSSEGRKLLDSLGVSEYADHGSADHASALGRIAGESAFDIIIEMLANENLELDLSLLSRGGRVLVVGSRDKVEITPRLLMRNESDVRGVMLYGATAEERQEIHQAIKGGARAGAISPVVQERVPLRDAAAAQRLVMAGGSHGKITLIP